MTAPLAHGGFAGSYEVARRHLADRSRLRALIDGTDTVECDACLGEGGFAVYPSEHSHRTTWVDCECCGGEGRVPL